MPKSETPTLWRRSFRFFEPRHLFVIYHLSFVHRFSPPLVTRHPSLVTLHSALRTLHSLDLPRRRPERRQRNRRVACGLRRREPDLVVIALGCQQFQQRCASFFVRVSYGFADILRLRANGVAIAPPSLDCIVVSKLGGHDIGERLRLGFLQGQPGLFARRLCR